MAWAAQGITLRTSDYDNLQEGVRRLLGHEIADRVGPIWGFDDHGAMRNMWMRTPQPGFWVMGGSLIDARLHSTFLAVQIKAEIDGIFPTELPV